MPAMPATTSAGPLSQRQIQQFNDLGYLMVEGVFNDAELQPVINELSSEIDRRAKDLYAQGKLSDLHEQEDFAHRLAKISRENDAIARAIWGGGIAAPSIFNLIRTPRLLDIAEQFCGPELIASAVYRLRPKLPNYAFGEVPWHQDSGYTDAYCDRSLMLTVWLPLVDADEENGCMWVIPGAHKDGIIPHAMRPSRSYLVIPRKNLPDRQPVCCPVPRGGVLLLTNMTPHASFENRTDGVRWSMDLRYQSAALPTNAAISRLAGEVVPAPDNDVPPACYPPEADFLVRSNLRPGEVVTDPDVFHRIRTRHLAVGVRRRWHEVVDE